MTGNEITTQLIEEKESDRESRIDFETMTEEERLLSSYADEVIGDSNATKYDTGEFNPS